MFLPRVYNLDGALVLVWAVKTVTGSGNSPTDKGKPAPEILQERYAKGEIDKEEFEQKRKDLVG